MFVRSSAEEGGSFLLMMKEVQRLSGEERKESCDVGLGLKMSRPGEEIRGEICVALCVCVCLCVGMHVNVVGVYGDVCCVCVCSVCRCCACA